MQDRVILGRIGSPFGVRGWVKVTSYTDPAANILQYPKWQIQHQGEWHVQLIESTQIHAKGIVAKLTGWDDRDIAQSHTHDLIAVYRDELSVLPSTEYYWVDLIGLQVVTVQGVKLGQIKELMATGANDVLVIEGEKKFLIPYISSVIKSVDLDNKLMVVDWDWD